MKLEKSPTLADSFCDLRTRKIKTTFFTQMNTLLDWNKIGSIIDQHYKKGKSATGKADDLKLINGYVSYYTDDTIKSIYWNDKKEIIFSFFDTVQTFNYTARNPTPLEDKCIDARVTV